MVDTGGVCTGLATPSESSSPRPPFDASHISGNAPLEIKRHLGNVGELFHSHTSLKYQGMNIFGKAIVGRLQVVEMSVNKKVDEERKLEGKVVLELDVDEEMINGTGNIHGGCSAFLVDVCSALSLRVLSFATLGKEYPSVSQAINMIYHSPAVLGDKLRIVNTSMSLGNRTNSCRTEIWNATHGRLAVSGTHVKMVPSQPRQANL